MKRILVVDDEESILKVVDYALAEAGYEVHTAIDGPGAEFMFQEIGPDLVILDVMLPGQVRSRRRAGPARHIERAHHHALGARRRGRPHPRTRVRSRRLRHQALLPARAREPGTAILRRVEGGSAEKACIEIGDLQIDTLSRQVKLHGQPVHLTTSEYGILLLLARHPGKAYSRQAILSALWDESPVGDERAVDVHIHNIREKIEDDPKNPTYLLTVRGFGYRLREP